MEYRAEYPLPVITNDDVRVIARYVEQGKLLPLTEDDVKKIVSNAPPALVTEITNNYTIINTHANSWEKVQDSMIVISSVLVAFSKDIHEYGGGAVEIIKNMDGYKSRKIDTLSEDELSTFHSISLDGDEQLQTSDLEQTIQYIKDSIHEKKRKSTAVLVDLDSFKSTLSNTIEPWIGKMIQLSNPDALDLEISDIRRKLINLENNISQAQAKPSFMQNILEFAKEVTVLMESLEKEKKTGTPGGELIKRREEALQKIASNNQLKGILQTLHISMGSLYDVVTPAINAVTQLHSHWESIIFFIDDSSNQFKNKATYAYLGLFVRKLEVLLRDWRNIEDNSTALTDAFRLDIK